MTRTACLLFAIAGICAAQEYTLGPDSQVTPGVPHGKVTQHKWTASKIYPGTERDYWIYVPAQYKPDKPACLMVFQDGGGFQSEKGAWRVPVVFDNLIHKGEMPVTIGVFISPGVLPARSAGERGRYNRSYEYDSLGDRYARFLLEEILPEVERQYNISKNPDDRAIAGSSSGGICAFTAAWNRPDSFHRVLSFVGSFTNLRGGDIYPSLIRKSEPKPLRVFLQDGTNDQSTYSGNWYLGNQAMASALEYAGYESKFVVGTEGHNSKHGSAILPDALRWLWKDYPKPVTKSKGGGDRFFATAIVESGSDWEEVSSGHDFTEGPAVDRAGNVFFSDIPKNRIYKIGVDGKVSVFKEDTGAANGLMFGPDARLYACQDGRKRIVAYSADGAESVIAEGVNSNDIAINKRREIWFTDPPHKQVWFIDAKGNKRVVLKEGIEFPNGVRLSPDQSLLYVADMLTRSVWSFQVQPDGSLANGEPFTRLELYADNARAYADGMAVDTEGFVYVATDSGLQVCDQPGRVVAILSKPQNKWLSNAAFGGPDRKTLYVTCGDKVYRRRMQRQGAVSWEPVTPPVPRL